MTISRYSECQIPTTYGEFRIVVYRDDATSEESVLALHGDPDPSSPLFVRIHSECFTSEVLGSLTCDCRVQLESAFGEIRERGRGAVIYLRQEGRGIGLGNKIRAYALQRQGADTVQANHMLGFGTDLRDFTAAALILKDIGAGRILLNTNNPSKASSMEAAGIEVVERIPSHAEPTPHNQRYLRTKLEVLNHRLEGLFRFPA